MLLHDKNFSFEQIVCSMKINVNQKNFFTKTHMSVFHRAVKVLF